MAIVIKNTRILINVLIYLLMITLLLSCDNNNQKQTEKSVEPQKPKIPEVVMEDLDDASSYDMARFQFEARLEGRDKYEIWSVKVDGSDLRLVLSKDELYRDDFGNISNNMSRSPDNRYVMLVQDPENTSTIPDRGSNSRILYDLKTRERTVIIAKGAVHPSIRWTEDSRYVMFYSWSYKDSEAYMYQYDVIEKKLEKGPNNIDSAEFYPVNNDTEFVAITKQGFIIYDWSGNKLHEAKLAEKIHTRQHAVSRNGKILVYKVAKGIEPAFNIINIENPKKIVYSFKGQSRDLLLDYRGKYLYYSGDGGVYRLETGSYEIKKLFSFFIDYFSGFIGVKLYNDKER